MEGCKRRFIEVKGRRVQYRQWGEGPPVVMLHASPANSEMVLGEMALASPYFTCFALETPGFGESDALPGDTLHVRDLAQATAEAMAALALPPCPVFGTHSGALVAIALAAGWPDRVTGLVLDGLPIFNEEEIATLFVNFFVTFPPDPLASHLTSTWMRFRDQFTWFPWPSRDVTRLNAIDRPTPEQIQYWVMMYYRARHKYMPAYRAILGYGYGARRDAEALTVPTVFMATREDMLFGHLDRLPPLKPGQRIARLSEDVNVKHQTILQALRDLPSSPFGMTAAHRRPAGDPGFQFVDTPDGQIFIRCFGDKSKPAVILLHDAPGSGLMLVEMARALAADHYVIVPDLPANGESDAPSPDRSVLAASIRGLSLIADDLGLERFILAGIGCGASVAAAAAQQPDPRLRAILLEDVPARSEATAEAIAPPIPLTPEGAHWVQAWLTVRDSQIYKPWFDGRVAAQRRIQGNFDAKWLHDQTFALMKSRASYHRLPREAYRFDTAAAITNAQVPVMLAPDGGLAALISST